VLPLLLLQVVLLVLLLQPVCRHEVPLQQSGQLLGVLPCRAS
jgi:hypothetical protein